MAAIIARYLPTPGSFYAFLASLAGLTAIFSAMDKPLRVLTRALVSFGAPTGWVDAASRWSSHHAGPLTGAGALLALIGLLGCGGLAAHRTRSGSTLALGTALLAQGGGRSPGWLVVLAVAVTGRLLFERYRGEDGYPDDAAAAITLGFAAAPVDIIAWLTQPSSPEPKVTLSEPVQVVLVDEHPRGAIPPPMALQPHHAGLRTDPNLPPQHGHRAESATPEPATRV